jgi:D-proline reductase (dithiol) PrdB
VIEKSGIATVSISLLPEVSKRVEPPRALIVNRPLGYPLGAPSDSGLQRVIIRAALSMLAERVEDPVIRDVPFPL